MMRGGLSNSRLMGDIYWGVGGCWTYEKREGGEQNLREKLHLVGEEFIYVDNW